MEPKTVIQSPSPDNTSRTEKEDSLSYKDEPSTNDNDTVSKKGSDIEEEIETGTDNLEGDQEAAPDNGVALEQTSTTRTSRTTTFFHDGGLIAWLQVVSGFFMMFNTWGVINTFGAFETYYTKLDPPLASNSAVSWIGSTQSFLLLFVGAFGGRIFDAGHARAMAIVGTALLSFSMLCTSFSGEFTSSGRPVYYQTFLAQGIGAGLGMGLLFLPSVAITSTYFQKKRGLAVGIVTSGSSVGGIIYPLMLRNLEQQIGFPWAVRALTLVIFLTLLISCLVIRQRVDLLKPAGSKRRPMFDWKAFSELRFSIYVLGLWFGFLGLYTPYFYLEDWALSTGVNLHGLKSYYLYSIMNGFGVLGRIIPNAVADWTHRPIITQAFCVTVSGLLTLCWIAIHDFSGVLAYDCLYGFFSGAFVSLPPGCIAYLTKDFSRLGARMGMSFTVSSFAVLIGTPVTGALNQLTDGWTKMKIFSGVVILVGSIGIVAAEVMKSKHPRRNNY